MAEIRGETLAEVQCLVVGKADALAAWYDRECDVRLRCWDSERDRTKLQLLKLELRLLRSLEMLLGELFDGSGGANEPDLTNLELTLATWAAGQSERSWAEAAVGAILKVLRAGEPVASIDFSACQAQLRD